MFQRSFRLTCRAGCVYVRNSSHSDFLISQNASGSTHFFSTDTKTSINDTTEEIKKDTWSEADDKEKHDKERSRREGDREDEIKKKILDAALKQVTRHGWTRLSLSAGAEDVGYISIVSGLFDRGEVDLVFHHIKTSNKNLDAWMIQEVEKYKQSGEKLPITKFIKSAVRQRLMMNSEYIKAGVWGEGLALLAQPANIPESVGYLQQVCDDIWYRAGDKSADMNWYSKRMLLAGIISSTEVFMIQDLSKDFEETWRFLDRRFEDIAGIPQIGKLPDDVSGILPGLVTTARNIAGIQK